MPAIRPYGDATGDGMVQLSFTLLMEASEKASEKARSAALELVGKMGFERAQVVHMKAMGADFTFFVVYAATKLSVDPDSLPIEERDFALLTYSQVNQLIRERLKRPLIVVGACTGTDAHTVGLDAILSMKGYAGDHGLEYFTEMKVVNLGAQVAPEQIVDVVRGEDADAVLISQVVTQRDAHLLHLRQVREALEAAGLRDRVILIGGGPRLTGQHAAELGYDRIFGRGTLPSEVASYLASEVVRRVGSPR